MAVRRGLKPKDRFSIFFFWQFFCPEREERIGSSGFLRRGPSGSLQGTFSAPLRNVLTTSIKMASKIQVANPVVEMDGDEMTRYVRRELDGPFKKFFCASGVLTSFFLTYNSVASSGK